MDNPGSGLGVLVGLILITVVVVRNDRTRNALVWFGRSAIHAGTTLAAWDACLVDWIVGYDPANGDSRRYPLWAAINLATIACWLATSSFPGLLGGALAAAAANVVLGLVNAFFLLAAYWAIVEENEIMNGDKPYRLHKFADLSRAKNLSVVAGAAVFLAMQVAATLNWLQTSGQMAVITSKGGSPFPYLDCLLVTLGALPFVSLYISLSGLAEEVAFVPGVGAWIAKAITTGGSFLIAGTIVRLLQQPLALDRLVTRVLEQTDPNLSRLMELRLLRGPSKLKRVLRQAYQEEESDVNKLKLIKLAVSKHSYSFPETFIRSYPALSDKVKADGSAIIARFVEEKGHQFDTNVLERIIDAAWYGYSSRAYPSVADRRQIGSIVLPCLERLSGPPEGTSAAEAVSKRVRAVPAQAMLAALLQPEEPARVARVISLLLRRPNKDSVFLLLRNLKQISDGKRPEVLQALANAIANRALNLQASATSDPLKDLVRAIDWNVHNAGLGPQSMSSIRALRSAVVARQRTSR